MKKKLILMLCVVVCLGVVGCGEKEVEANVSGTDPLTENESITTPEVTPANELEQTPEEPINNIEPKPEEEFGEVFGDVDVFMTMDDMEVKIVGDTIELVDNHDLWANFGMEEFKLLFPRESFLIDSKTAETAGITFHLAVIMEEGSPSFRLKDGVEVTEYSNYTLRTEQGRNSANGFQKEYDICNLSSDSYLYIRLDINKTQDEYQELADSLTEEFVPAFEEILLSNLQ